MGSDDRKTEYVYVINQTKSDYYKIGRTNRSVASRLSDLQTANPVQLIIVHEIKCTNSSEVEAYLHKKYAKSQVRREWFQLNQSQIEGIINEFPKGRLYEWS
jgi:hypothetical protein